VDNGHGDEIWQVPYAPGTGVRPLSVEVLTFAGLRRMDPGHRLRRLHRPQFHVLALIESGEGRHRADFVDYPLRIGSIVWIRPGVVHQWTDIDSVDGSLVLFTAGAIDADTVSGGARPLGPGCWQASGAGWDLARLAAHHLAAEHHAAVGDPQSDPAIILKLLLGALLARISQTALPPPGGSDTTNSDVFHRYRTAVEANFAVQHQVVWYARHLGYAPRTLTRATRAAVGIGAKRFLDERITLEAKRLLAHTDLTVARCARRLGFPDQANFTTFFQRQTGTAPTPWRRAESTDRTQTSGP
jgi:AraC-like DNA-binding protein